MLLMVLRPGEMCRGVHGRSFTFIAAVLPLSARAPSTAVTIDGVLEVEGRVFAPRTCCGMISTVSGSFHLLAADVAQPSPTPSRAGECPAVTRRDRRSMSLSSHLKGGCAPCLADLEARDCATGFLWDSCRILRAFLSTARMATSAGVEIVWPPAVGQLLPHELVHPSLALALSGPDTTAAEAGGGVGFFAARSVLVLGASWFKHC